MSALATVTPEILLWARKTVGMSIEDVVHKLGQKRITSDVIERWEKGEEMLFYSQLEILAKIYERPVAIFFFPEPLEEETPEQSFRTAPGGTLQIMSPVMHILRRRALAMRANLIELYDGKNPVSTTIPEALMFSLDTKVEKMVKMVREFLKIDLQTQIKWKDEEEAFNQWREAIEQSGIFIFKDSFKDENVSGFCLHHDKFPLIYINSSNSKSRQIFTIFHELAHILLGKGSVDFLRRENIFNARDNDKDFYLPEEYKLEIICNNFAGKFLVPERDFNDKVSNYPPPHDDELRSLARLYKVSREVILRKYLDRKIINQEFYESKTKQWAEEYREKKEKEREYARQQRKLGNTPSGPDYYILKSSRLGKPYLNVAFGKYYRKTIDEFQLAGYLRIKAEQIPDMESVYSKG